MNIEYYYPEGSNRYVTITGKTIFNYNLKNKDEHKIDDVLHTFLESYMKRRYVLAKHNNIVDDKSIDELIAERIPRFKGYILVELLSGDDITLNKFREDRKELDVVSYVEKLPKSLK